MHESPEVHKDSKVGLMFAIGFPQDGPTRIFEDNETCRVWSTGMVGGTNKSKHMDLRKLTSLSIWISANIFYVMLLKLKS